MAVDVDRYRNLQGESVRFINRIIKYMRDNQLTKIEDFLQPALIRNVEVKDKSNQTAIFRLISLSEFATI